MPTDQELRQELVDLQQLVATDGWETRIPAYVAAMSQEYHDWIDSQIDVIPAEGAFGYGRLLNEQGVIRGLNALLDYVPARIAEIEDLLPPE